MSNQFEYPGLADKIAAALSFQRHAKVPPSRVALDASELSYIASCISYYVSSQQLEMADEAVAETLEEVDLESIEQYRLQMAAISTAAIGYWHEGHPIHADYDTPALRDVAKLYARYDELYRNRADGLPPIPDTLPCETEQS